VFDASSGELGRTLMGHEGSVNSLAFGPGDGRLVSASFDETLLVWDFSSGDALLTLRGHTVPVAEVAFDPNGARVVSGSFDGSVLVWETTSVAERSLAARAAALVERLREEKGGVDEAVRAIENEGQLDEALRAAALVHAALLR
jgi:WD40 repeat protein